MKKNRYRIQIETKRNGKKQYQAHVDVTDFLWFKWMRWNSLVDRNKSYNWFYFDNISAAEEAINHHRKISEEQYQEEIINIEYKHID